MPTTRQSREGRTEAAPPSATRRRSNDPGSSCCSRASFVLTTSGAGSPGADEDGSGDPLTSSHAPPISCSLLPMSGHRCGIGLAARRGRQRGIGADQRDSANLRQPRDLVGQRRRAGQRRPVDGRAFVREHANVVAGSVEEIAERKQKPLRQQQHVEEQRADDGHAADRQARARRIVRDRAPREAPRAHRRTSEMMSRRRSVQEPTSPARMPRGTASATDCSAIRAVTRTKTSVVS